MQIKKIHSSILSFGKQVCCVFTVLTIVIAVLKRCLPIQIQYISKLFSENFSITIVEILILSSVLSLIEVIFRSYSERRSWSFYKTTLLLFLVAFAASALLIRLFGWIPDGMYTAWLLFVFFYIISFFVTILIQVFMEKANNAKLTKRLNRYKEEQNGSNHSG